MPGACPRRPRALAVRSAVSTPARPRRPLLFLALGLGLLAVAAGAALALRQAPPLEDYGALPAFTFTREDGRPFGSRDLAGAPYVANFIFTRCPTVCPVFSRKMAGLQQRTADAGEHLRLVSFSVDPAWDTPERLAAYAKKYGADPTRWAFLTGDFRLLKDTVQGGFKVSMGRESAAEPVDPAGLMHGTHFVLVDGRGHIRGYYLSNDAEALERLRRDARRLADEVG